eukprot:scaffold105887_cov32-Prasinocladus_malaysianus.AAC.1
MKRNETKRNEEGVKMGMSRKTSKSRLQQLEKQCVSLWLTRFMKAFHKQNLNNGLRSRDRYRKRSSPGRGGSPDRQGGRDGRHSSGHNPPPPPRDRLPDKPELYGCYRGRVSGMMDFGAFVELLGFPGKAEGLVHLSNMAVNRPSSAKEVVTRGQASLRAHHAPDRSVSPLTRCADAT